MDPGSAPRLVVYRELAVHQFEPFFHADETEPRDSYRVGDTYCAARIVMSSDCFAPAVNVRTSASTRVTVSAGVRPDDFVSAVSSRSSP